MQGRKHTLEFEIVNTSQQPLLSGSTCERLGLMQFTISASLNAVDSSPLNGALRKETLIEKYQDVFTAPIQSVPGVVHFQLNPVIQPVQSAPCNVPDAMRAAIKAQLKKYEVEGHITSDTEPADWISNMLIIKKTDKLRIQYALTQSTSTRLCCDLIISCPPWRTYSTSSPTPGPGRTKQLYDYVLDTLGAQALAESPIWHLSGPRSVPKETA